MDTLIPLLPDPILLSDVLAELRDNLSQFPEAMLGEVGLDRICRIPYLPPSPPPYALHDGSRALSPFKVPLAHQLAILEAQLDLAVELRRNVSIHSVKSQAATVKLFDRMKEKHKDKWTDISVDLHSCGLSVPSLRDIQVSPPVVARRFRDVWPSTEEAYERVHVALDGNQLTVTRSPRSHCCMS